MATPVQREPEKGKEGKDTMRSLSADAASKPALASYAAPSATCPSTAPAWPACTTHAATRTSQVRSMPCAMLPPAEPAQALALLPMALPSAMPEA